MSMSMTAARAAATMTPAEITEEISEYQADAWIRSISAALGKAEVDFDRYSVEDLFDRISFHKECGNWGIANRLWLALAARALREQDGLWFLGYNGGPLSESYYAVVAITDGDHRTGIPCPLLSWPLREAIHLVGWEYTYREDGEGYDA